MAGSIPTELGTKSIKALLRQYAVPGIIAMTASSLYNMVDSIFIGHIPGSGPLAISGLAVTFPLMNISAALGTLVGVGAATMISVLLGQKNYEVAGKVLSNEVTLNTIVGLLFTVVTMIFMDPILLFFGASENTLPFARDYMMIIAAGNVITHLYFGLNSVIRSSGNPNLAMGLTLFTVISNAILDPVFIYILGMGIRGAAIATVLCQTLALAYTLWYFLDQKRFLHLNKKHIFRLDWRIAKDSLAIGMGPFLMNLASCIVRNGSCRIQPWDAADRRLQLRSKAVLQGPRSIYKNRYVGDNRSHCGFHSIRVLLGTGCFSIYKRPAAKESRHKGT